MLLDIVKSSEEDVTLVLEESNGVRPSNDPDLYPIGAGRPLPHF